MLSDVFLEIMWKATIPKIDYLSCGQAKLHHNNISAHKDMESPHQSSYVIQTSHDGNVGNIQLKWNYKKVYLVSVFNFGHFHIKSW